MTRNPRLPLFNLTACLPCTKLDEWPLHAPCFKLEYRANALSIGISSSNQKFGKIGRNYFTSVIAFFGIEVGIKIKTNNPLSLINKLWSLVC